MSTREEKKRNYLQVVEFFKSRRPKSDAIDLSFPAMGLIEWVLTEKKENYGSKEQHVRELRDAIVSLKKATKLDPTYATPFYYMGIAHLTILEIDDSFSNTSEFVNFCKDGIACFVDALHCDSPPLFTSQKIDKIVLLAEKKGIYLSVSWDEYKNKNEHEFVDVYNNEDERATMIELKKAEKLKNYKRMKKLNKAEKLRKVAKTLLERCGSIVSQSERTLYIAAAISKLDEASLICPEDSEANNVRRKAYDLLSKEAEKGKEEVSLSTNGKKDEYMNKNEHEYEDVFGNGDERMIELDKAEKLKKDAKTILELSGSIESRSERAKTIADAIAMLDEALSINPKDNEAEKEIGNAYDLLSNEVDKVRSSTSAKGKGEVSLSTIDNKKKDNASLSAEETKKKEETSLSTNGNKLDKKNEETSLSTNGNKNKEETSLSTNGNKLPFFPNGNKKNEETSLSTNGNKLHFFPNGSKKKEETSLSTNGDKVPFFPNRRKFFVPARQKRKDMVVQK